MKLILLSGGSGKRLWPLSNDARSKQFLRVLTKEDGTQESMVQRVWRQLGEVKLAEDTIIATSKSQVDILQNQLGTLPKLVVEPERRDTFPAIALASTYLYSVSGVGLEETIAVLPVDPYVENNFFSRVIELESILQDSNADLALIGVKPTSPSDKYGYIVPKQRSDGKYGEVSHFKEKPNEDEAKRLLQKSALWNCGVFSFKLGYIISMLEELGFPIQYESLLQVYHKLPQNSFDYEVVEKANDVIFLPYEGSWKDLGTWNTLTDEMSQVQLGKGMLSPGCENSYLINELDIPINVIHLSNVIVAASPDGILVSDKESSTKLKDFLSEEQSYRPMYEERRWGWYRVLDYTKLDDGSEVLTKRICVKAGRNLSYQFHYHRREVWTVIKGEGEFVLDDRIWAVKAGSVIEIPVGAKHAIKANEDLEFIEVQVGAPLIEEDIVRIYMTWDEIEENCESDSLVNKSK
ncbi:cupin domain-containing protein [Bacillus timonensis]|nr:cupin domain-containing protein [Bacillus timonensis]